MKITIEKEVKTVQEAYDFIATLLPKTRVVAEKPERVKLFTPEAAKKFISPPVRNFDANREIIKYVRAAGRAGRTTEDMARDLANLGAGKNRFYFAQKAYELLSRRRLARFTGEGGQYVYVMPYFRKGAMVPKPKPEPKPAVVKYSHAERNGSREVSAAAQLLLEDRKEKGAVLGEIRDLAGPSLKKYSPNFTSAMVSILKKKGVIVARRERVEGMPNKYRYFLPAYAPVAP